MAQNINSYGSITKIGSNNNGRVIYQVTNGNGEIAGKVSIPETDCDIFEKSYKDIMETAPNIQKFAQKHSTPESIKKLKKTSNWITGICTAVGAGIGIFKTSKLKTLPQIFATAVGLISGFVGGLGLSYLITTPSGMTKFNKATKNISKLDIKPEQ